MGDGQGESRLYLVGAADFQATQACNHPEKLIALLQAIGFRQGDNAFINVKGIATNNAHQGNTKGVFFSNLRKVCNVKFITHLEDTPELPEDMPVCISTYALKQMYTGDGTFKAAVIGNKLLLMATDEIYSQLPEPTHQSEFGIAAQ